MSAALVSALVAALAVIVSGIMQYLTLQAARRNALLTANTTERTTRITALASSTEKWEQGIREDLAEFAPLTYHIDSGFKYAMSHNLVWPGDKMDLVDRAEVLFNRIRLRLDETRETDERVIRAMRALMDSDSSELWITRRDSLVNAAVVAFRDHWEHALSRPLGAPAVDYVAQA